MGVEHGRGLRGGGWLHGRGLHALGLHGLGLRHGRVVRLGKAAYVTGSLPALVVKAQHEQRDVAPLIRRGGLQVLDQGRHLIMGNGDVAAVLVAGAGPCGGEQGKLGLERGRVLLLVGLLRGVGDVLDRLGCRLPGGCGEKCLSHR